MKPWKILETKYLHPGFRVDQCELPGGHILDCQLLEYADEIMIFAMTIKQEVVLIKQYRHGAQQVILELPGGSVDEGELPIEAAQRELMEETGYASDTFIEVGCGSPNPAIYRNKIYFFLAIDAKQTGSKSVHDTENIGVSLIPLDEVIVMAMKGDLINFLNISALFFVLKYLQRIS
ncbi:MAG TPA: NUDIX hydrolase [Anaerolineales bacterium]|nr:NUDIX hydrolase [Anaerolineales bacterium]